MKKLFTTLFAVLSVLAICTAVGCADSGNSGKSGDVVTVEDGVVFTVKDDIITLTDTTSLKDYLDALKENGDLSYAGENGNYGFYVTEVNGKKAEGNGFWGIYCDLVTIEGDDAVYSSTEWGTYEYGDKTLGSANVGVSNLPCISGYTYALIYSTY